MPDETNNTPALELDKRHASSVAIHKQYTGPIEENDIYNAQVPNREKTIYPVLPHKQYSEYIGLAEMGDDAAQYRVAMALNECRYVSDIDEINVVKKRFYNSHYFHLLLERDYGYCSNLFSVVPHKKIKAEYEKWLIAAMSQGNNLALATHWFDRSHEFSQDQARNILERLSDFSQPDTYYYIAAYFSKYGTDNQDLPWRYAHCKHSIGCSEDNFLEVYRSKLIGYEFAAMIEDYKALTKAISSGERFNLN